MIPVLLPGADSASFPVGFRSPAFIDLRDGIDNPDQMVRLLIAIATAKNGQNEASLDALERDRSLAAAYSKLGDAYWTAGGAERARIFYMNGLAIREKIAAAAPDQAEYQRDLSISYDRMGSLLSAVGLIEEARQDFQKSLMIA